MKFTIQALIETPGGLPLTVPVQTIERSCDRIEDVGLRLEEAKSILNGLQDRLVRQQLAEHLDRHRACPDCHRPRTIKGYHPVRFRSAFGDLRLRSPRWMRCSCEDPAIPASYSALNDLLTTHTAPELEFLQAKWAAHLSFSAVADLLHDVLPVDAGLRGETVRTHVFETAERLEAELGPEQVAFDAGCQLEIEASPEPGPPIAVGLGRSRAGRFLLMRKTRRDQMRTRLRAIKTELRRRMHMPIGEQGRWLAQVVRGYFGYHAVPTNSRSLSAFRFHVTELWRRTLRRRSQRDRSTWDRMSKLEADFLPLPRILHPWPTERFNVTHPRWKPDA